MEKVSKNLFYTINFFEKPSVTVDESEAEDIWTELTRGLYGSEYVKLVWDNIRNANTKEIIKKNIPKKKASMVDKLTPQIRIMDPKLPLGFEEIEREYVNPKFTADPTVFIYAKNPTSNEVGFKVINGKEHPFARLGNIMDKDSTIGAFYDAIPENETMIANDFMKLMVNGVMVHDLLGGRRLKAVISILTYEGYLKRTPKRLISRRGAFGYYKSSINHDGNEGESNGKSIESSFPTEPIVSRSPSITIGSKGGPVV